MRPLKRLLIQRLKNALASGLNPINIMEMILNVNIMKKLKVMAKPHGLTKAYSPILEKH